jgi:hypothetical protein
MEQQDESIFSQEVGDKENKRAEERGERRNKK